MLLSKILKSVLHETYLSSKNFLYIYHGNLISATTNKPLNLNEAFEYYKVCMVLEKNTYHRKNHCTFNAFVTHDRLYTKGKNWRLKLLE